MGQLQEVAQVGEATLAVGQGQQPGLDAPSVHGVGEGPVDAALIHRQLPVCQIRQPAVPAKAVGVGMLESQQVGGVPTEQRGDRSRAGAAIAGGGRGSLEPLQQGLGLGRLEHRGRTTGPHRGHSGRGQGVDDGGGVVVGAHQHRDVAGGDRPRGGVGLGDDAEAGLEEGHHVGGDERGHPLVGIGLAKFLELLRIVASTHEADLQRRGDGLLPGITSGHRRGQQAIHGGAIRGVHRHVGDARVAEEGARPASHHGVHGRHEARVGAEVGGHGERVVGATCVGVDVHVGTAETVDGLLGIADQEQAMLGATEQRGEDLPLQVVGVLELVDERSAEAVAHRCHQLLAAQGAGQAAQQILIAQRPALLEALGVGGASPVCQLPPGAGGAVAGPEVSQAAAHGQGVCHGLEQGGGVVDTFGQLGLQRPGIEELVEDGRGGLGLGCIETCIDPLEQSGAVFRHFFSGEGALGAAPDHAGAAHRALLGGLARIPGGAHGVGTGLPVGAQLQQQLAPAGGGHFGGGRVDGHVGFGQHRAQELQHRIATDPGMVHHIGVVGRRQQVDLGREPVVGQLLDDVGVVGDQLEPDLGAGLEGVLLEHLLAEGVDGADERLVEGFLGLDNPQPPQAAVFARSLGQPQQEGIAVGAGAQGGGRIGQAFADAVLELCGGRAGEGDHQDLAHAQIVLGHQAHHQVGDLVGLARASGGFEDGDARCEGAGLEHIEGEAGHVSPRGGAEGVARVFRPCIAGCQKRRAMRKKARLTPPGPSASKNGGWSP